MSTICHKCQEVDLGGLWGSVRQNPPRPSSGGLPRREKRDSIRYHLQKEEDGSEGIEKIKMQRINEGESLSRWEAELI